MLQSQNYDAFNSFYYQTTTHSQCKIFLHCRYPHYANLSRIHRNVRPDGPEPIFTYRRTGVPTLLLAPEQQTAVVIALRFKYSSSEQSAQQITAQQLQLNSVE